MSLTRIYNSKLYLTNSRKDRIHAALQDPLNVELVQQVSDYLDDDSKEDLKQAISEKDADRNPKSEPSSDATNENVFDTHTSSGGGFSDGAPSHHSAPSDNVFDDMGDMPDMEGGDIATEDEPSEPSDAPSDTTPPTSDIEESTEVVADDGIEVTSSEEEAPAIQSGIIKKLLNDQEDTKGVVRVDPTDDEVWIYYEDKVNLNDVMDNVITVIKDTYNTLKFSRLARTDNAVVFDIKE